MSYTVKSRSEFVEHIDRHYDRFFNGTYAIGYLHVHRLKHYNRAHGVHAGDKVLHSVIDLLAQTSADGLVARYAGNGLVLIAPIDVAESLVYQVNDMLPTHSEINGLEAKLGLIVCKSPRTPDECMDRAHFACDNIAHDSTTLLCRFEGKVKHAYDKRMYVVDHLDDAIANGEIQAWAQPIVRVLTGRTCEMEILARWQSKRYGFLYPDEFIPVLEQHELIHKLDLEVIRLACAQWAEAKELGTNVPFGINLSRLDFELCDIHAHIREFMERYNVPVSQIHIEVTESSAVKDDDIMTEGVRRFRAEGFQVYMDDFGSGYSSLGQMADLRFDVIKIDKGMLDHVTENERARAVLADTVSLVKRLGMQTLCEGVETLEQLQFLKAVGCEKAQGYYFGKPASHEQTMRRLNELAVVHENPDEIAYLDAVGLINLIDGTSAGIHGIEAAAYLGRMPVAVLEIAGEALRFVTGNAAFQQLVTRMGEASFDDLASLTTKVADRIVNRAKTTARLARTTGKPQTFDFIARGVFCSATMQFIAQAEGREAYLSIATSLENAPQVTEHTLLEGVLETSNLCFFWKDTERRFLGVNQRFLDYYGFESMEEVLGKTDEDMAWHEDNQPFHDDEVDVLKGKTITAAHGVCLCRGEMRDIIATKRPLYSHGAIVGLVGYFEDIGLHQSASTAR